MSLNYRQERRLRLLEAGLIRSDPYLASIMGIFGRLYAGQRMPGWEHMPRVPSCRNGRARAVTWVVAALAATTAAISILLSRGAGARAGAGRQHRPPRGERAEGGSPWPDAPA
jgi:hypothetical protein